MDPYTRFLQDRDALRKVRRCAKEICKPRGSYVCKAGCDIDQALYPDDWTADQAVELWRAHRDRPRFLWVNFPGPHPPAYVTAAMLREPIFGADDDGPPLGGFARGDRHGSSKE